MPKSAKALAAAVKEFRLVNEMTHEEAADELGVSYGTYYAILKERTVSDLSRAKVENRLKAKAAA